VQIQRVFISPSFPLSFPHFPSLPLSPSLPPFLPSFPLEVGPPKIQLGGLASAVSYPRWFWVTKHCSVGPPCAITLFVVRFADTSVKERLWQLLPRSDNCTFQFLHRHETSAGVNHLLECSPNSIVYPIQIWVVWWSQCHVRLDEWHFRVNCIHYIVFLAVWDGTLSCCSVHSQWLHLARMQ